MKFSIFSTSILFAMAVSVSFVSCSGPAEKELAGGNDPPTAAAVGEKVAAVGAEVASVGDEVAGGPNAILGTEYSAEPLPNLVSSSKTLPEMKEEFAKGFAAAMFPQNLDSDTMGVRVDQLEIPNLSYYKCEYRVLSVKSKDGKFDMMGKKPDQLRGIRLGSNVGSEIQIPVSLENVKLDQTKDERGRVLSSRKIQKLKIKGMGTAEVEFTVKGPEKITVLELTEAQPTQEKGGVSARLKSIKGSTVQINYKANEAKFYAVDETGQRLKMEERSGSKGFQVVTFRGKPLKIIAVLTSGEEKSISVTAKVDLNEGKPATLDAEPATDIPTRYLNKPMKQYQSVTQAELDALQVQHFLKDDEGDREIKFFIKKPNLKAGFSYHWFYGFFGQNSPVVLKRISAGQRFDQIVLGQHRGRELHDLRRAFGRFTIKANVGIEVLSFQKQNDGEEIKVTSATGQEYSIVLNKNQFSYALDKTGTQDGRDLFTDTQKQDRLAFQILDKSGRRLQIQEDRYAGRRGRASYSCWGIPDNVEYVVREGVLTREYDYEFDLGETDEALYSAYKKQYMLVNEIGQELAKIGKVMGSRAEYNYTVGGMHYVHGRKSNEPLKLVSEEIAKSDLKAAKLFGYEVKPYKGYYFTFPESVVSSSGEVEPRVPAQLEDRTEPQVPALQELTWEGGEVKGYRKVQYSNAANVVVAWPADPTDPVVFLYAGKYRAFYKVFEDGKVDVIPLEEDRLLEEGWTKGPTLPEYLMR